MSDPSDGSSGKPGAAGGADSVAGGAEAGGSGAKGIPRPSGGTPSLGRKPTMPSATRDAREALEAAATQAQPELGPPPPESEAVPSTTVDGPPSWASEPPGSRTLEEPGSITWEQAPSTTLDAPPMSSTLEAAGMGEQSDPQLPDSAPRGSTGSSSSESGSQPSVLQVLAPHVAEEQDPARHRDKMRGLVIIGVTFVLCILGSLWAKKLAEPEQAEPPRPPTTEGIVGWPNRVEPVATLSAARQLTRRDVLRGFVAEHVRANGTIDFKQTGAQVRYSFQSNPGEGPQPPRASGTLPRHSFCGRQNVVIGRYGIVADPDLASFPCSAKIKDPLPPPRCNLKQVWDFMIEKERVPKKRPARIEYYQAKAGPAFRFTLPGTKHRASISGDCKRRLKPTEAVGGVP